MFCCGEKIKYEKIKYDNIEHYAKMHTLFTLKKFNKLSIDDTTDMI